MALHTEGYAMNDMHTEEEDRSETISFRTSEGTKHLVRAVAARRGIAPSDWLREVVTDALEWELRDSDHGRD